jgi:hypothetical protein
MASTLMKECFKHKKCPICGGMMSHTIEKCECAKCGRFLSDDCCHGEKTAIDKKRGEKRLCIHKTINPISLL